LCFVFSTILKQIKANHQKKLSSKELQQAGNALHQNVIECFRALLRAHKELGCVVELDDESKETARLILGDFGQNDRISQDLCARILKYVACLLTLRALFSLRACLIVLVLHSSRLWSSEAIQKTYSRKSEFWLLDSFPYYLNNLQRFCDPEWLVSEEDVVMARVRTTGIVVTNVEEKLVDAPVGAPECVTFQVVDVGGQRNERKKWIHCFSGSCSLCFSLCLLCASCAVQMRC
jgi:hypothetical protein